MIDSSRFRSGCRVEQSINHQSSKDSITRQHVNRKHHTKQVTLPTRMNELNQQQAAISTIDLLPDRGHQLARGRRRRGRGGGGGGGGSDKMVLQCNIKLPLRIMHQQQQQQLISLIWGPVVGCHRRHRVARLVPQLTPTAGCRWIKIVILLVLMSIRMKLDCSRGPTRDSSSTLSLLFDPSINKTISGNASASQMEIVDPFLIKNHHHHHHHHRHHQLDLLSTFEPATNGSGPILAAPYGHYDSLFDQVSMEPGWNSIELGKLIGQLGNHLERQLMMLMMPTFQDDQPSESRVSKTSTMQKTVDSDDGIGSGERTRVKRMVEDETSAQVEMIDTDSHSGRKSTKQQSGVANPKQQLNKTHMQLQSADYNDDMSSNEQPNQRDENSQLPIKSKKSKSASTRAINRAKQRRQMVSDGRYGSHHTTSSPQQPDNNQPALVSTLSPAGLAPTDDYQRQQLDLTTNDPGAFDENMPIPITHNDDNDDDGSLAVTSISGLTNDDQFGSSPQTTTTTTTQPNNAAREKPDAHGSGFNSPSPLNHRATVQANNEQLADNGNSFHQHATLDEQQARERNSNPLHQGKSSRKSLVNSAGGIKRSLPGTHETHASLRNPPPPEQSSILRATFDDNNQLDQAISAVPSPPYADLFSKSLPQVGEQSILEQANASTAGTNEAGSSSSSVIDTNNGQQQQQLDDQKRLSQLIKLSESILNDKKLNQNQHLYQPSEDPTAGKFISYNDQLKPSRILINDANGVVRRGTTSSSGGGGLQMNDNTFMPISTIEQTTATRSPNAYGATRQPVSSNTDPLVSINSPIGIDNYQTSRKLSDTSRHLYANSFFNDNTGQLQHEEPAPRPRKGTKTSGKSSVHETGGKQAKLRASGSQTHANIISSSDANLLLNNYNALNYQPATADQLSGLLMSLQQPSVLNNGQNNLLNLFRGSGQQQQHLSKGSTSPLLRISGKTSGSSNIGSSSSSNQILVTPLATTGTVGSLAQQQQQPIVYLATLASQQQQQQPMVTTATLGTMLHPTIAAAPSVPHHQTASNRQGSLKFSSNSNGQQSRQLGPMKRLMTSGSVSSGRLAKMTNPIGGHSATGSMFDEPSSSIHSSNQGAASNDPIWSDTQNQEDDYQQAPQTIQITAVPNGLVGNGFGNGWNGWNGGVGGWNGWGAGGPWNGRQVLLVNRQPPVVGQSPDGSDWRSWALPIAIILALPLILGALFVPLFLKSVMFLIQILQMLGLLMPPHQLANHITGQVSGSLGSSG